MWALPGARIVIEGVHLPMPADGMPHVLVGSHDARVVGASARSVRLVVPPEAEGGAMVIRIDELPGESVVVEVARPFATGVHQVDSPVFDQAGRLYVTQSGGRETKVPVPLYRVGRDGVREPLPVEIANPTSLAIGPDGTVYVSSRFDSRVYRLTPDDQAELYASELGVPTGLAVAPDGTLFVGDRSGSILKISTDRRVEPYATIPPSVAAFHLAYGPDHCLYVTAPTLATRDALYRITPDRLVETVWEGFGRPQGLAFDSTGMLYVVEALAGSAGLYRIDVREAHPKPELVLSAGALIGVAFDPRGGIALASNDTIWRLEVELRA
jgi:sugar lactone lactonase YvrE